MANHYNAALEQAKDELKIANAEIQRLLGRKTALENLVKMLTFVESAGEPRLIYTGTGGKGIVPDHGAEAPPTEAEMALANAGMLPTPMNVDATAFSYLWKQIAQVMKSRGPFTIAQAGAAVEQAMGRVLGHTRSQQVRNSLIRHPEMFRRDAISGTWTVTGEVTI